MSNLRLNTKEPYQTIFSLTKHPQLGFIIDLVAVKTMQNGEFGLQSQKIHLKTASDFNINPEQLNILKILNEIDPDNIAKKFNPLKKELKANDFFTKIYDDELDKKIKPFIEKRMIQVIQLLQNQSLFLSKDKNYSFKKINIESEKATILFHFRKNDEGTNYFATIKFKNQKILFNSENADIVINEPCWMIHENSLFCFNKSLSGKKLLPFFKKRYISIPKASEPIHYEKFVKPLIENYDVYAEGFEIRTEKYIASPLLKLSVYLDNRLCLGLFFNYGPYQFSYHSAKMVSVALSMENDKYIFNRVSRSKDWENTKVNALQKIGIENLEGAFFISKNPTQNIIEILNQNKNYLLECGFKIDQSQLDRKFFIGESSINLKISDRQDWFDINALVKFGTHEIPFIKLKHHIIKGIKEFLLPDGNFAIIPEEWFVKYSQLLELSYEDDNNIKLKKFHYGVLENLENELDNKTYQTIIPNVENFVLPKKFNATLRDYQIKSYHWLRNLHNQYFGACLADDMGLGKTVQILNFLQYFKENFIQTPEINQFDKPQFNLFENNSNELLVPKIKKTSLVIVPTSLVYNWKNEIEKYTHLSYHIHSGPNRTKDIHLFNHQIDIIITTYGTMRNDIHLLKKIDFDFIILDEAQAIKNIGSQTTKSIFQLKGKQKIVMTGTPIENSITDLWSIFNFINPGLLGSSQDFQRIYVDAIEKDKNKEKINQLRYIIQPFILRRTKEQVAKELPEKTEKTIYCEMEAEQEKIYTKYKNAYRNELLNLIRDNNFNKQKLNVLNGLIRLRQIANHPKLYDKTYLHSSGKFKELKYMIQNIVESGHKALIFSQFVQHLKIVEEFLLEENLEYLYIDGSISSKKRQESVTEFQSNDKIQLFLIQLKSGGSGLNLTAADYVLIIDPWWNPAVERQAMDRTHRIGQTRPVFVYKFITKNTIEEKILQLQQKKHSVSEDILEISELGVNNLNDNEIKNLLD
ncbi:MAG: SNF2-related protein [Bacteroidota bacterium]|nr:SNF2-related protein [Bacteroidota bacterium]